MAEKTIVVTESMAEFIAWAQEKGKDEITGMISERLAQLKEFDQKNPHMEDKDGFKWDNALEPNEGIEQWKHGGDCNKCRKAKYCKTQCRPNRKLKEITTPFLYHAYLEEHPEAAAKGLQKSITPEDMARMVNLQ